MSNDSVSFDALWSEGSEILLHKSETPILTILHYTGDEKKCWDCGRDRLLFLRQDINGELIEFEEACDNDNEPTIQSKEHCEK